MGDSIWLQHWLAEGGNFYVWTEDPTGEWSDPIWLEYESIDPSFFFDDDGSVYLTAPSDPAGIYQVQVDLKTGKNLTEPTLIWRGMGGRYPEGPHIYHVGDYYYLMISEGGTEYAHRVTLARSRSLWGEYEPCPHNPIFTHMNLPHSPLQATGHADLVQDHLGNWWMVCLAIRPSENFPVHHLGRETILVPISWDDEAWLVVNNGNPAQLTMQAETLPLHLLADFPERDDFEQSTLHPMWNSIRQDSNSFCSLNARAGWLRMVGTGYTLDEINTPAFIGRRQQHLNCEIHALLDYIPTSSDDEAGLTLFQNEDHHYELSTIFHDNERYVAVRQKIGVLVSTVKKHLLPDGLVTLIIQATPTEYHFFYRVSDDKPIYIATGRTRYLSTEVAGGFTGVFVGMYVYGQTHVDFDWMEIKIQ